MADVQLIKVSRARVLTLDFRSPAPSPEMTPTDTEREWFKIFDSKAPELAVIQRKISVCVDAEIDVLENDRVGFTYDGHKVVIQSPAKPYNVSRALGASLHDGFSELCNQGRVTVDGMPLKVEATTLGVDTLNLIIKVADKFFFQSFV